MPYTSPATAVTGTTITSAWGNSVKAALDFLSNPPRAEASRGTTLSITSGPWTPITFTTEVRDTDNMFTTGSGDRFTCVTPGRYLVIGTAPFAANVTGLRAFALAKGVTAGVGFFAEIVNAAANSGGHVATISGEVVLAAADTVSFQVLQTSGAGLNLTPGAANTTEPLRMTIRYVAAT